MPDPEVSAFRTQLKLLHRRLRQESTSARGLSRTALQVLAAAGEHPCVTPGALAEELLMATSNVAAALRELDAAGLVTRDRDSADGRRVNVSATQAGRELVATSRAERDGWLVQAMGVALTAGEREALLKAGALMARLAEVRLPDADER